MFEGIKGIRGIQGVRVVHVIKGIEGIENIKAIESPARGRRRGCMRLPRYCHVLTVIDPD